MHVTDGCFCSTAHLEDISPDGLCLSRLADRFARADGPLTVFAGGLEPMPVVHVRPRWAEHGWDGWRLGGEIADPTTAWRLFFIRSAQHALR